MITMKSLLRRLVTAFLVLAAIGLLAFLVYRTQGVDPQLRNELSTALRELRQVDTRLDIDVLRSRMGLNNDYDPLSDPVPQIGMLQRRLVSLLADGGMVLDEVPQLQEAFGQKLYVIDQFKAQNAILQNSLRYVPTAADEIQTLIRRDARAESPALQQLNDTVVRTLNDTLRYNLMPDSATSQQIEQRLGQIQEGLSFYPKPVAEAAQGFINHVRAILRQRAVEAALMAQLDEIPVPSILDSLMTAVEENFALQIQETDRYRNYLAIYSAFLLCIVLYFAVRLVNSFRMIARANQQLQEANEFLEQRVQERTADLRRTMEDLKASEAQLIQSEKMASLGQMVAGVAHEINTPLGYVRSSIETLAAQLDGEVRDFCRDAQALLNAMYAERVDEAAVAAHFSAARQSARALDAGFFDDVAALLQDGVYGIDQIRDMVLNLKNFSRLDRSRVTLYRIEDGIESTLQLAKQQIKHLAIVKNFGSTVAVRCSPSQLNQVFLNLITNAAQAVSPENGVITIITRMQDSTHLAVEIADNGKGIPAENLTKIFDPFFTTKAIGQGTGLGLSIVYKIIEQHGGQIKVSSKEGEGTVFTIVLPTVPPAAMAEEGAAAGAATAEGAEAATEAEKLAKETTG